MNKEIIALAEQIQIHDEWPELAACKGLPPGDTDALFFPTGKRDPYKADRLALCGSCPVQQKCLAYGYTQEFGAWGGLTEDERRNR